MKSVGSRLGRVLLSASRDLGFVVIGASFPLFCLLRVILHIFFTHQLDCVSGRILPNKYQAFLIKERLDIVLKYETGITYNLY